MGGVEEPAVVVKDVFYLGFYPQSVHVVLVIYVPTALEWIRKRLLDMCQLRFMHAS